MCRVSVRLLGFSLALLIAACGGMEPDDSPARGASGGTGKADIAGSCKGFCGGQSADGCYCDNACAGYGDCCSDKAEVCDGQVPPQPCHQLDEQLCNGRSDCEWTTYPGFPGDISMCVEKSQPDPCDPMDAGGVGPCAMFIGYKWTGSGCVGFSGCSCQGADCGNVFMDKASCEQAYSQCLPPPPPCNTLNEAECDLRDDCAWETYPGFPGPISMCVEKQEKKCYVGGCSSEVCSDKPDVVTPCIYPPIGGLPPAGAVCQLKADGNCGWVVP
jgi:hypothetical protein